MIQIIAGNVILYLNLLVIIFAALFCYRRQNILSYKLISTSFLLLSICLINLLVAFIENNYHLIIVAQNSHEALPFIYKTTALWGNHSGSFLLLTWMVVAIFIFIKSKSQNAHYAFLALYIMLNVFITFNSNPFAQNPDIVKTGQGFNPLLQDIAITIHPPILYLGNTILICIYCLNFSNKNTLLILNLNKIAWTLITFGIALGSWWAYRELGWGGIWFWDPVENISLLPWLCSTALLHYQKPKSVNKTFRILAFSAALSFIYGLVIMRSGIVASVHSFAVDMNRGAFLAAIFITLTFMAANYLIKQKNLHSSASVSIAIKYNNILLILALIIIIFSTIYPISMNVIYSKEVSVDELFFINSLAPITYLILIGIIFLKNNNFLKTYKKLAFIIGITLLSVILYYYLGDMKLRFKIAVILSSIVILFSVVQIILSRKKIFMHLGHASFSLLILAIALHYAYSFSQNIHIPTNSLTNVENFRIRFISSEYKQHNNFLTRANTLEILAPNNKIYTMRPELRFFPVEKIFTVESAVINYRYIHNLHVTTGDMGDKMLAVDFKYQAYINLIWFSAFLLGSIATLSYLNKRAYDKNKN